MVEVFLSLGSNVAPREHIVQGLGLLHQRFGRLRFSPVYECPPVGFEGENFINLVVGFDTDEPSSELAAALRAIESQCGRRRGAERFVSRTFDADLILYGDLVQQGPPVSLPRDDILRYAFVLRPLAELAPERRHPVLKRTFADLWRSFNTGDQPLWPLHPPLALGHFSGDHAGAME